MKIFNINNSSLPIFSWCPDIEESALKQIENITKLPFLFKHIAIMPDCHSGYGMPIGGVVGLKNVVSCNMVGVDIGCGMCAVKTSLTVEQLNKETTKKIFGGSKEYQGGIRSYVPMGMNHHSKKQDEHLMPALLCTRGDESFSYPIVWQEYESALKQLGTLGGGNHFIEFQKDEDNNIWIMIHSGSRNIGHKVATHYNNLAIALNEKWYSKVMKEYQLAFLPLDSEEGQTYVREMEYCVAFAKENRKVMMSRILAIIENILAYPFNQEWFDVAHNYARMENHFGHNVMIHRKGATSAREGEIGIIPGSQGSCSYIVKGLGNENSFMSCSHGAGRTMSRTKAQATLNLEDEIKHMDSLDIVHGIRTQNDLDECASAYKNIEDVMENQKDLVQIVHKLKPIAVMKG